MCIHTTNQTLSLAPTPSEKVIDTLSINVRKYNLWKVSSQLWYLVLFVLKLLEPITKTTLMNHGEPH